MSEVPSSIKPAAHGESIMPIHGTFCFECRPGLPCFTRCCGDVTIYLTPYDILRLKNRLGISSEEFIERYAIPMTKPDTGLPVFILKMNAGEGKRCPLVTEDRGCLVYSERPWACRMFPLDTREGEEGEDFYFITADPDFCKGLSETRTYTIEEWEKDQGLDEYKEVEALFNQITEAQRVWGDHKIDGKVQNMIYMACYNTEKFRKFVFESNFLKLFDLLPEEIEALKNDDLELLKFGFKWLQFGLLGKSTIPVREEVIKAKEKELGVQISTDDRLRRQDQGQEKK